MCNVLAPIVVLALRNKMRFDHRYRWKENRGWLLWVLNERTFPCKAHDWSEIMTGQLVISDRRQRATSASKEDLACLKGLRFLISSENPTRCSHFKVQGVLLSQSMPSLPHDTLREAVNLTDVILLQPTLLSFMFDVRHQLCSYKKRDSFKDVILW